MTTKNKTFVTPEMAENIRVDFKRLIDFWVDAVSQCEEQDEMGLALMGLSPSDFEDAGTPPAQSVDTEWGISTLKTLRYLAYAFEKGSASGTMYLEDGLAFYENHIRREQETNPENHGEIGGYVTAQRILTQHL